MASSSSSTVLRDNNNNNNRKEVKQTVPLGEFELQGYLANQLQAEKSVPSLLLYPDDPSGMASIAVPLEVAYPRARYYPEVVNGITDLKTYLEQKNKAESKSFAGHDDWMLNYVDDKVTGADGQYFQLILPDGRSRRVMNSPDEVCQIIGANNVYPARRYFSDGIYCGGKVYNKHHYLEENIPLSPQPLRIYQNGISAADPKLNQELKSIFGGSEPGEFTIPSELTNLISGMDSYCARLTDNGKECFTSRHDRLPQSFRFHASGASESSSMTKESMTNNSVDCAHECLGDGCPGWISDFILKIPGFVIFSEKNFRDGTRTSKLHWLLRYILRFVVSDTLQQSRTLILDGNRDKGFPEAGWQVKERYEKLGGKYRHLDSTYRLNNEDAIRTICRFLSTSGRLDDKLLFEITIISAPQQSIELREAEGPEFSGPAGEVYPHLNFKWDKEIIGGGAKANYGWTAETKFNLEPSRKS